jgi:hypothetical protein
MRRWPARKHPLLAWVIRRGQSVLPVRMLLRDYG